jgi:cell division GTPase FtsZ
VIRPEQQDEIMITVIATGFEEKVGAGVRPPQRVPQTRVTRERELDTPTFRREQMKKAVGMDFTVLESELDSADLDIPTFLRRQAD